MNILVSGSLAYDRIMDFPGKFEDHILPEKIHILNVCFTVSGLAEYFGGTAGNIAYSLALLDEFPTILASAGKDFGRYRDWLVSHGLPLEGIRLVSDEFTAGAYITTDMADNQITGFNPGAMKLPSEYDLSDVNPAETWAIISPGNPDDMLGYSRRYKEMGIRFIFDPGQQIPILQGDHIAEMIEGSEILISNDYELEMIIKATGWDKTRLLQRTRTIITTLGEDGSVLVTPKDQEEVPVAKPARVVDPTGAGDAYRAGLLKGLAMGKDLHYAATIGATCASYAVEIQGTQEHRFTPEQVWDRHKQNFAWV